MPRLLLEDRARKLLKWKITKEGESPNPFKRNLMPEINYLLRNGYITQSGENPKTLSYDVTCKGRHWAFERSLF